MEALQDACSQIGADVHLTGLPAFYDGIVNSAEQDLELMDGTVLPLALILLALLIKSFRLLALPLASLGVSAAIAFASVYALTQTGYQVMSAAPSLMTSIFVAMNFDYNLFLLSRFQEEIRIQRFEGSIVDVDAAVAAMVRSAGHTVFVSGATLCVSLFALVTVPLNLIQSLGVSCGLSLAITLMVCLTLVPAALLAFPVFFVQTDKCFKSAASPDHQKEFNRNGMLFRVASWTQTRCGSLTTILVVTALVAAAGTQAFHPIIARSVLLELPTGTPRQMHSRSSAATFRQGSNTRTI